MRGGVRTPIRFWRLWFSGDWGLSAAEAELREDGGGEGGADRLQRWRGGFGAGGVVAVVVMRGGAVGWAGGLGADQADAGAAAVLINELDARSL